MSPVATFESSVASLTRCASPPESWRRRLAEPDVVEADVVQGLQAAVRSSGSASKNSTASPTDISSTSAIDLPLKRTSSVSRL